MSRRIVHTLAIALVALGCTFAPMAMASEISGTLSSDGSSDVSSAASVMETTPDREPRQGTLGGTVMGGVSASAGDAGSPSALIWTMSIALIVLAVALSYVLWRKPA